MNSFEHAFVILHIKISGMKIFGIQVKNIVLVVLIFLLLFGVAQIYLATRNTQEFELFDFIGSVIYTVIVSYITLLWFVAWPKAQKHLSDASDIDRHEKDREKENFS